MDPRPSVAKQPIGPPAANRGRKQLALGVFGAETSARLAGPCAAIANIVLRKITGVGSPTGIPFSTLEAFTCSLAAFEGKKLPSVSSTSMRAPPPTVLAICII
jgi:hypothetical protein